MADNDSLGYPMDTGRKDIDLGAFVNVRVTRTAARLSTLFHREALKPNNLSLQEWRALLNIAKLGDCHLRQLSRIATLDPSHASRATVELEKRGMIERYPDRKDKRRTRMRLTNEGNAMVDKIWPIAVDLSRQIEERLGPGQIEAMNEMLDIVRNFANERLDIEDSI